MSDSADRYRRLAAHFTEVVEAVPDDAWNSPSPCEGWTAADVVDHVADSTTDLLARFDLAPERAGDDPLERWLPVRDAMQDALDDPAVADTSYEGYFGPTTLAETVDGFFCPDLVIHAWDLARAVGLEQLETMPADEVTGLDARFRGMGEVIRSSGAFGPEVPVPDDAPPQDRLLGLLGRTP